MAIAITPSTLRDRLRDRHRDAVERRIAAAQTAAARLGHGEVPWDDIRSAHRRPDRTVAGSYWSIVSEALAVIFVLGFFLTLIASGVVATMDAGAEGHLTPAQQATFLHAVPMVAAMLVVIALLGTGLAHLTLLRVGSTARPRPGGVLDTTRGPGAAAWSSWSAPTKNPTSTIRVGTPIHPRTCRMSAVLPRRLHHCSGSR